MIIFAILLLVQTILNAIQDSITHHDGYKSWGYFFSKDAAEEPKYNWFHKYFPMFFDMWHLSKVLQTLCIVGIILISTNSLIFVAAILVARGLLFNIIYK
jgi:hypothetical protein